MTRHDNPPCFHCNKYCTYLCCIHIFASTHFILVIIHLSYGISVYNPIHDVLIHEYIINNMENVFFFPNKHFQHMAYGWRYQITRHYYMASHTIQCKRGGRFSLCCIEFIVFSRVGANIWTVISKINEMCILFYIHTEQNYLNVWYMYIFYSPSTYLHTT